MPSSTTWSPYDLRRPVAAIADCVACHVFSFGSAVDRSSGTPDHDVADGRCERAPRRSRPTSRGRRRRPARCARWPNCEFTSSQAAVPSRMPTSISPIAVSSATEPRRPRRAGRRRWRSWRRRSALARSTAMLPLAALTRRSPVATPTQVSPLEFLITALPSSSRCARSPEPVVTSARPVARSTVMSPAPVLQVAACPVWSSSDVADAGLEPALAEPAVAAEVRRPERVAVHVRAGGQLDRHVDRAAALAEQPGAQLRRLDQQLPFGVLDPGLLGGSHVVLVGRVARPHLDDGVGAVARGDPDVADGEVDRGRDRFGGVEGRHGGSLLWVRFEDVGSRCGSGRARGQRTQPV